MIFYLLASFFGFSAVLLGAVGAHVLRLGENAHSFELATRYQLIHALLLLFFASKKASTGAWFVIIGSVFFCGSIYLKTFTANAIWTEFAPVGGVSFMLAWLSVAFYSKPFK